MSTRFYKEEVGFEPTERVNVRQFSRLLQSTALALLHTVVDNSYSTCTKKFVKKHNFMSFYAYYFCFVVLWHSWKQGFGQSCS